MNIELNDLLQNDDFTHCLCVAIAEKLVEKGFFDSVENFDDYGNFDGFSKYLKEDIKTNIKNYCLKVIEENAIKMLDDNWQIKNAITEAVKQKMITMFSDISSQLK